MLTNQHSDNSQRASYRLSSSPFINPVFSSCAVRKQHFFVGLLYFFIRSLIQICFVLLVNTLETADTLHMSSSTSDWQAIWKMSVLGRPKFSGCWMLMGQYLVPATDGHTGGYSQFLLWNLPAVHADISYFSPLAAVTLSVLFTFLLNKFSWKFCYVKVFFFSCLRLFRSVTVHS